MKKIALMICLLVGLLVFQTHPVYAMLFGFDHIVEEGDGPSELANGAIGEAQLFVEVTDAGPNQVLFTFSNIGPEASSICDVYFDDGTLLGIASIDNSDPGVSFSQGASPGELPGGNNLDPPFETTQDFLADSDSPVQSNGVNPGEYLGILFDLQDGQTFDDVLNALAIGGGEGGLRIGIHVQGFANGGSEAFVNKPPEEPPIPEPTTILLVGLGLLGIAGFRKKLRK